MAFIPRKNRVLIELKPYADDEKLSDGILMSEFAKKKGLNTIGTVKAVGQSDEYYMPKVGSCVMVGQAHNGIIWPLDGKPHLLVHVDNIYGTLIEEENGN